MDMHAAWDKISAHLSAENLHEPACFLYGPWAPPEAELRLLGDVRGQSVLEIGCGAGQCSVALARQGAHVTGLDLSTAQLAVARARASAAGVAVDWQHGRAEDLTRFVDGQFDRVIASYVLPYVADLPRAFGECARVLRPGGRMLFAFDHPLRTIFYDEADEELVIYPSRSYFDNGPFRWRYVGPELMMDAQHRTIAQWLDLGRAAGLSLVRLVEPPPPAALLDEVWPADDARAPLRNLPQAIIFVMTK